MHTSRAGLSYQLENGVALFSLFQRSISRVTDNDFAKDPFANKEAYKIVGARHVSENTQKMELSSRAERQRNGSAF